MEILRRPALPFCFTNLATSLGAFLRTAILGTGYPLEIPWKCCSTARVRLTGLHGKTRASTTEINWKKNRPEHSAPGKSGQHVGLGSIFGELSPSLVAVLTRFLPQCPAILNCFAAILRLINSCRSSLRVFRHRAASDSQVSLVINRDSREIVSAFRGELAKSLRTIGSITCGCGPTLA
jgi:hypothetical protein